MKKIFIRFLILILMTFLVPLNHVYSIEFGNVIEADTAQGECVKKLIAAIDQLNTEEAIHILEGGCNVNGQIPNNQYELLCPITCALKKCDSSILSILLTHGADPKLNLDSYYTPFEYAIENCPLSIVKLLFSYIDNVNFLFPNQHTEYLRTPLNFAITHKKTEVAKYFIEKGASINQDSNNEQVTSLILAIVYHQTEIVKELLDHGADINAQFTEGDEDCITCPYKISALHEVVIMSMNGEEEYANHVLDLLLHYKPDPNILNEEGFTPLGFVSFTENLQMADKLIKYGARLDKGNHPALHCAVMFSNYIMTQHLLGKKVSPNQQDIDGNTPLLTNITCCGNGLQDLITRENRIKTLTVLINAGANPLIKNSRGESFLDFLKQANLPEIEKLLIQKGLLK